jgi:hypothetical protein
VAAEVAVEVADVVDRADDPDVAVMNASEAG